MIENNIINELILYLQILIGVGGSVRIAYCLIAMNANKDEADMYKKRGKHTLAFVVISVCITGLMRLVMSYF